MPLTIYGKNINELSLRGDVFRKHGLERPGFDGYLPHVFETALVKVVVIDNARKPFFNGEGGVPSVSKSPARASGRTGEIFERASVSPGSVQW